MENIPLISTAPENQTNPLISVIIPVYNYPDILKDTLNSVLNQTYSNFEILVIDDGSETDIYSIIEMLNDNRIRYYKQKRANANVARNYGIQKSNGRYIAMLDSDDLWLENHLSSCLALLQQEEADGLYGSLFIRDVREKTDKLFITRDLDKDERVIDYLLDMVWGAQTSTLFIKKECAEQIPWNNSLKRHQDYDFVIRFNKKYTFAVQIEPTVIYTVNKDKKQNFDFESCIRVIEENEEDISPHIYNRYHLNMLNLALSQNAPKSIIDHYVKEATYYKEYMSYYQFLMLRQPKSNYRKMKCKFEYLYHIFRIGVD